MSTHNIYFHGEMRKVLELFVEKKSALSGNLFTANPSQSAVLI